MRVALPVTDITPPTGVQTKEIFNTDTLPNWPNLLQEGARQLTCKIQNDKGGILHVFSANPKSGWVPLVDITVLPSNTQLAVTGVTNLYHFPLIGFARFRIEWENGGVSQTAAVWKPWIEIDNEYGGFVSC